MPSQEKGREKFNTHTHTLRRRQYKYGGRDWSDMAKECQQPLEAGIGKERILPLEPMEGVQPCQHHDFRPPASRTMRG